MSEDPDQGTNSRTTADREPGNRDAARPEQVLADYLLAAEAGHAPDQEEFIGRHPDLAEKLRDFFAADAQVRRLARPMLSADPVEATGLSAAGSQIDALDAWPVAPAGGGYSRDERSGTARATVRGLRAAG